MNIKNNIGRILKSFISLIFAGYLSYEIYSSLNESETVDATRNFFSIHADDIVRIDLNAGTNQVVIKRQNKTWLIESPLKEKASQELIKVWLENLRESDAEAMPNDHNQDIAKYGLSDPLATIKFYKTENHFFEIAVSATKTFDGQNYVMYSGPADRREVLISNFPWFDFILKKPIDFINTLEVMAFDGSNLFKVELTNLNPQPETEGKPFQSLAKASFVKDNDLWNFKGKLKADGAKVESLLTILKSAIVYRYEPNILLIKDEKSVVPIFELNFIFNNKQTDKIVVYNYYRPCVVTDPKKKCQLVTMSSKSFPFWVEPQDMATVLNLDFLKK